MANNLNNLSVNFFKELNNVSTKGSEPYNHYEFSRFFVNMRFFNLVNFANLLPTISTKSLTSYGAGPVSNYSSSYFSQNQNAQNLDFNFNNLVSSPETLNTGSLTSTKFPSRTTSSLYVNYSDYEVFNPASLELFGNLNTTNLSTNDL